MGAAARIPAARRRGRDAGVSEESAPSVPGADVIAEYLDETRGLALGDRRLLPEEPLGRVEVRRLMRWFNVKFYAEASYLLVTEKIYKRYMNSRDGGGAPDMDAIRVARANLAIICATSAISPDALRLAGDKLTYADLAAAAHLSCVDYLGDAPWNESETAKAWYTRIKSRPRSGRC